MDYNEVCEEPESEIELGEILWDLLSQWKAILIVALVVALVVPGVKFLKDKNNYEMAATRQQMEVDARANKSPEELIEEALSSLSEEDKAAVQRLAKQQELIMTQETYLNDSLLLSGDLANQRHLVMRYYLTVPNGVTLQPLADAYKAFLLHGTVLKQIGQEIGQEADLQYVRELVNVSSSTVADSTATGLIETVDIVLPADADAAAIQGVVTSAVDEIKGELTGAIGPHEITALDIEKAQRYDSASMDRRVNATNSINALRNSYATAVKGLTKDQQATLEVVNIIEGGMDNQDEVAASKSNNDAKIEVPSISLKFVLLGFASGAVLYAVVYMAVIILSRRVSSAAELEAYTGSRLLGCVCYAVAHNGLLDKLLHSNLVDKRRYGRKGDVASQVAAVVSAMESVCEHARATSVTMLCMGCKRDQADCITKGIATDLITGGIETSIVDATEGLDEKLLLNEKNALFVVGDSAKTPDVWRLTGLCCSYDVERLGCVYLKEW